MLNRKVTIFVVSMLVVILLGVLGGYYYYKVIKPSQTTKTTQTGTTTKTDAQIKNETLKNEVIKSTPEPEGIAQPKYVPAPTPPSPAN